MAKPLIVSLPPDLELWEGCIIRVHGLDPTTGAEVAGIKVSNVTIEVAVLEGALEGYGPWALVTGPSG
jgi:ABC-type uncharacterized transport system permease subunit